MDESPTADLPTVSIVIAVRNEASSIERCIDALRHQDYPSSRLEILISDGRSEDDTRTIVNRIALADSRVRLVDNPMRITPAAFNAGLQVATGSVLGIMSGHAEAAPDYVSRSVAALRDTGAWAVGGRILREASTPAQEAIAKVTSSPFGVGDSKHNYADAAGFVETVFPGMWSRATLARVGIFDTELQRNQDDELSFRIREAGGTIWYDPAIRVRYEPRGTLRALFRQYRQYGSWKVRVYQKHPRAVRPRQLVPATWVGVVVGGTLLGFLTPIGWVAAAAAAISYMGIMLAASGRLASPDVGRARLLVTFLALHAGYGAGMWMGAVRFAPRWVIDRRGAPETLRVATV
jgi:cellulose synthase/poly-beta-1,6-N-acetylglucosamine synthase-like glycosyltransferase